MLFVSAFNISVPRSLFKRSIEFISDNNLKFIENKN